MIEIIEQKKVVTKKEHQCLGCLRKYPLGTEMQSTTAVDDNLYHYHLCQECLDFLDTLPMFERNEDFCEGDLLENENYPNREKIRDEVYKRK